MNQFRDIFDTQNALFATGVTRSYEWLIDQLDRMATMISDNEQRFQDAVANVKLPFDFIFFTGSTTVGKVLARAAAENLTPVILELGGQNPALVDETANIPDAAKKIAWGATASGGQWCTSPGYAYVHESVAEEFVTEAKQALVEMYGEDPKSNPDYARIISPQAVDRLYGLIDQAKVVAGGRCDRDDRYLDPTILYPVSQGDKIMEDEIFGPILPVLTYRSLDEAFERMAATPTPLAGYVFSRNQATINRFLGQLSFGGGPVNQNNVHLILNRMPFGGLGVSGMGHYYGKRSGCARLRSGGPRRAKGRSQPDRPIGLRAPSVESLGAGPQPTPRCRVCQDCTKVSRSASIVGASVVGMPCGKPL